MVVDVSIESFSTLSSMREGREKLNYDEGVVPTEADFCSKQRTNQGCKAS